MYRILKPEEKNVWLPNLTDDEYFKLPETYHSSSGIMSHFRQDAKSKEIFERVKNHTPALQIGSLIHAHLLSPEILPDLAYLEADLNTRFPAQEVPEDYVPEERVSASGRKYKKTIKRKPSAMERVEAAVAAAKENSDLMMLINNSKTEYAGVLEDFHGIKVRIKADAISFTHGVLTDIKTSTKSFKKFAADAVDPGSQTPYYVQAALYLDVANELNRIQGIPERFDKFVWGFVGTQKHEVELLECPDYMLDLGRELIQQYIQDIKKNGQ